MNSLFKKLSILLLVVSFSALGSFTAHAADADDDKAILIDLKTERAVIRAIALEPSLADNNILVGCVDGVISLSGQVDDDTARAKVESIAAAVSGVAEVRNHITTKS